MQTVMINNKPLYMLTAKEEIVEARDYMENNWSENLRPQLSQLAIICFKYFKCKLSELK